KQCPPGGVVLSRKNGFTKKCPNGLRPQSYREKSNLASPCHQNARLWKFSASGALPYGKRCLPCKRTVWSSYPVASALSSLNLRPTISSKKYQGPHGTSFRSRTGYGKCRRRADCSKRFWRGRPPSAPRLNKSRRLRTPCVRTAGRLITPRRLSKPTLSFTMPLHPSRKTCLLKVCIGRSIRGLKINEPRRPSSRVRVKPPMNGTKKSSQPYATATPMPPNRPC